MLIASILNGRINYLNWGTHVHIPYICTYVPRLVVHVIATGIGTYMVIPWLIYCIYIVDSF